MRRNNSILTVILIIGLLMIITAGLVFSPAQGQSPYIDEVRRFEMDDVSMGNPAGLAYSPEANAFWTARNLSTSTGTDGLTTLVGISMFERAAGNTVLSEAISDPLNIAYNPFTNSLYAVSSQKQELLQLPGANTAEIPGKLQVGSRYSLRGLGLNSVNGISFDPQNGRLFILDTAGARIWVISPDASANYDSTASIQAQRVISIELSALNRPRLQGLAFNPSNQHLYLLDVEKMVLLEVDETALLINSYDISGDYIHSPQGMVFAPSGDTTDDPNIWNLFLADAGINGTGSQATGGIIEYTFSEPILVNMPEANLSVTLVRTVLTSNWNPPSPDPAGLEYWHAANRLVISDSEVEEMNIWDGANIFITQNDGTLVDTCNVLSFTKEPTDVTINPNNGHFFISDDGKERIYEIDLGGDGQFCTGDDSVTFLYPSRYGISDAEGVGFAGNSLVVADGSSAEIWIIHPGPNGQFENPPNFGGDDVVTHFDTKSFGAKDPEDVGYNSQRGTLFIVSRKNDTSLYETSLSGNLLNIFDVSPLNAFGMAGVGAGPGSLNPSVFSIYIVARGVDNNQNPNENDGKLWEVALTGTPPTPTTPPPTTPPPTPPPPGQPAYLSLASNGSIGGLSGVRDEDIVYFDGTSFSMYFQGADVGVSGLDLNAFTVYNSNTILMSFNNTATIQGVGTVNPWDIVMFQAVSTGNNTSGTFSMYFQGSDVGFGASQQNIDAVSLLPGGDLLISVTGNTNVLGYKTLDEDLLRFTPTSLGSTTAGSWSMYFDGSDVGLSNSSSEDIDALHVDTSGNIYLSAVGLFEVQGISGSAPDIYVCGPTSLGENTSCNFLTSLYFQGSLYGISSNNVDGYSIP